ncbi:MAG: ribonuclease III [Butyrivibrio sp.]|nr:ribonuclease III [Butyrivibrio sp.]
MITEEKIHELEEKIGYEFKNKKLLKQALTHSSFANEQKINKQPDYERLEFLGDSVLEMVSSTFLYNTYPDKKEGEMTKMRASMVCEAALAYCAADIGLSEYIILGKGEEATGGRHRESIISDVMEAVIGAIYLDGGIDYAIKHINRFILSDLENKQIFYDSKSVLQEIIQSKQLGAIHYELCGESGPEHDKIFKTAVYVEGRKLGEGAGKTKKAAEQKAAYEAILAMKKD